MQIIYVSKYSIRLLSIQTIKTLIGILFIIKAYQSSILLHMFTLTRLYKHKCFSGHIIFRLYKVIALNMNIFSIYSGSLCILEWVHWEFFISLFLTLWRNQKVGKTCTLLMTLLGQKVIYYFVGYPLSNWKLCSSKKDVYKGTTFW